MTNQAESSASPRQNDNTEKTDDQKYNDTQQVEQTELDPLGGSNMDSNTPNSPQATTEKNKNFFNAYKNQIIIAIFMVLSIAFIVVAVKYGRDINKLKTPKPVMLYKPTEEYMKNTDKSTLIKWTLLKEHSQEAFLQYNASHLKVNRDGFFLISCSLLIESQVNKTNVLSLLVNYGNKNTIYSKKALSIGYDRFPIQLIVNLRLKRGEYISVEITPSKYILKGSDSNYLSIVLIEFTEI